MSYARVSILGQTSGGEVWSVNPVFDPTGEFPGWNQANADAATAAIDALTIPTSLVSSLSNQMSVTGCRLEVRQDFDDSLIGISIHARSTPVTGSSTPIRPPQTAIVFSIRTNTPGGSGRGRLYWPAVSGTLSSAFRQVTPAPSAYVADMKTYLTAIQSALATAFAPIGFNLAVRSKTTHTTPHAVRIQVGDILDTQRRRRDHLPESYSSLAIP